MLQANPDITFDLLLSHLTQEEIMERYIGINPSTHWGKFRSPLRKDTNPTCTFAWVGNKLLFRDWAMEKALDCVGVVMQMYDLSFPKALNKIASDFMLVQNIQNGSAKKINFTGFVTPERSKSDIVVEPQPFTDDNKSYLAEYGITGDVCKKFAVFSPKRVWLNGKLIYYYHWSNPALAYYFGVDDLGREKWKIYFYRNTKTRFLGNTNRINGWVQIPKKGKHLVITKSLKDVMCFDLFDVPAVAMQSESQTPYDYIIEELEDRFDNLITVFDNDLAGITRAHTLNNMYEIPWYIIEDPKAKDFSDYIQAYGLNKARILLGDIIGAPTDSNHTSVSG